MIINNHCSDVTIIVNSCDKYEDTWYPFFRLLKTYWPCCDDYDIILNTETKQYNCDFMKLRTINCEPSLTWSERLKNILDQIDTEFVLFFLDDFFIKSPVNNSSVAEAISLMKSDDKIGYIGLKYNKTHKFRNPEMPLPEEHFFNRDLTDTVNRINCNSALWRKDWLTGLLRKHESPWEFEKYGSIRSRRTDKKVLIINNVNGIMPPAFDYNVEIKYGHGLTLGQWLPKNQELFAENGIEVNFDNLGINYAIYESAINPKSSTEKRRVEQEPSLRETLYNIKKIPRKAKKKIIFFIRKCRSLI